MAEEKEIDVLVKWSQQGAADVGNSTQQLLQNHRAYNQELAQTEHYYRSLRQAGRELGFVSREVTLAGTVLTAALVLDANNYVKTVGATTKIGAEWLASENRIKQANLEIGQSAATVILPAMQKVASITESIAGIVQANPWIISTAVTAGGILTAVGAIGFIVSRIITVIADLGLLLGKLGLSAAGAEAASAGGTAATGAGLGAGGAALGTVVLTASSVIIGAEIGQALGNWLGQLIYGQSYKQQNIGDAIVTALRIAELPALEIQKGMAKLFPSLDSAANKWLDTANQFNALIGKLLGASQINTTAGPGGASVIPQQAVTEFTNFQQQMQQAEQTYDQQRLDIVKSTEQQMADSTANYENQRSNIVDTTEQTLARDAANFALSQKNALTQYQDQVAKEERNFRQQEINSAKSHALQLQQLAATHNQRINDLAAARDALGLVKEQQSYQLQVSQSNSQFALQQQQAKQAFQTQMADQRQAYEQQRAQALAAYNQQVADAQANEAQQLARLDAQHQLEMAKLQQQEQDKLQKLDASYKKQVDAYQKAFVDRINAIDSAILGDTAAYNAYLANQAIAFQNWIHAFEANSAASAPSLSGVSGSAGGYASGGYVSFKSPGEDGKPEYVLSHKTTRSLESAIGGKLSQANILSAIMSGRAGGLAGGGPNSVQIKVESRNLTLSEIRYAAETILNQRLGELIPAMGA